MKIEQLTLTNFRGVAHRSLSFHPEFNLIVGVNGVGKTSVLDVLRVTLAHTLHMFCKAPRFNIEFQTVDLMRGSDEMTAELIFSCHGEGPYTYLVKKNAQSNIVNPTGGLREQTSATPGIRKLTHAARPKVHLSSGPAAFKNREDQPLGLHFSVSRSRPSDERSKFGSSTNPGYFGAFLTDRGLRVQDLVDWLRNKEQIAREAPEGNSAKQKAAVLSAITTMLPELSNWRLEDGHLWVSKQVLRQRINRKSPSKELHVVFESMNLQVEELSDGERSLVVLGFDIARRLAQLNPDDPTPTTNGKGVVLIDELDLHLHPTWQRQIIGSLRGAFPAVQFICTTHSPFLIQALHSGTLIDFNQPTDEERPAEAFHQQSIEDIAEEVQGVEMPQKSQRYLDMMAAAEQYYTLLRKEAANPVDLAKLKVQLDELSVPFSDDPAFQSLLKQQRLLALGDRAE